MQSPATKTTEPVITVAGISSAVSAVLSLLVPFGLDLSEAQTNGILGAVAVVAPLVVTVARKYVTPVNKIDHSHE